MVGFGNRKVVSKYRVNSYQHMTCLNISTYNIISISNDLLLAVGRLLFRLKTLPEEMMKSTLTDQDPKIPPKLSGKKRNWKQISIIML